MILCPLTGSTNTKILYTQKDVPLFQNKTYNTSLEAKNAQKIDVTLAQCLDNGFVFSAGFDINLLEYNADYNNEQSSSGYFQQHLDAVIQRMQTQDLLAGKVLEIGCGKGYFLNLLLSKGVNVTGIDPTYEGESTLIIKDYYGDKYSYLEADFIILRHTLEHIPKPFEFIKMIAKANKYKGKIYIEIPTFDWIVNNNAVEDIFYEHCNYFVPDTIQLLFESCDCEYIFNGQYLGVIADLSRVKNTIETKAAIQYNLKFNEKIESYSSLVNRHQNVAIWGAGAKGSTFLNMVDKNCEKIKCVIDINPLKQGKYIAITGHPVISPSEINQYGIENIIVMNHNYYDEIKTLSEGKANLIAL